MSPDTRHRGDDGHAPDQLAWLMRQRRRQVAEASQLIARLNRIISRRTGLHGIAGLFGGDEVRLAAGIRRPRLVPLPEPVVTGPSESPLEPEPPTVEVSTEVEDQTVISSETPPPDEITEVVEAPDDEAIPEPVSAADGIDLDVMSDIKAAAAEALAVDAGADIAEAPDGGAEEMVEVVFGEGVAAPEPVPVRSTPAEEDLPFELVIEPGALVPGRLDFVRASDEVLFNRAIEYLGSRDLRGMREGIKMLGRIPGDTAANVLKNLYGIAPPRWRPEVAHELVNHGASGIKEFFCQVLDRHDGPPVVRIAALRALYSRDKALATEYLLTSLGDGSDEVRATSATYLGWLREPRAMPLLEKLVGDKSQAVSKAALHAASSIRL